MSLNDDLACIADKTDDKFARTVDGADEDLDSVADRYDDLVCRTDQGDDGHVGSDDRTLLHSSAKPEISLDGKDASFCAARYLCSLSAFVITLPGSTILPKDTRERVLGTEARGDC